MLGRQARAPCLADSPIPHPHKPKPVGTGKALTSRPHHFRDRRRRGGFAAGFGSDDLDFDGGSSG